MGKYGIFLYFLLDLQKIYQFQNFGNFDKFPLILIKSFHRRQPIPTEDFNPFQSSFSGSANMRIIYCMIVKALTLTKQLHEMKWIQIV